MLVITYQIAQTSDVIAISVLFFPASQKKKLNNIQLLETQYGSTLPRLSGEAAN